MPEIIFKTGTGTFSGDISANDASFNNVEINGDLQVNSDLHINGSIGNNLDVIGNLNVGGYIKQRTASWSLGGGLPNEDITQSQLSKTRFKWVNRSVPEINCFYESDDSNTKHRSVVIEIPGRYYISFTIMSDSSSLGYSEQFICKNENTVLKVFQVGPVSNHLASSGSIILDLDVGDYVYIYIEHKAADERMRFNTFCGYLIG